ncbi:FecR family protein [Sphingobium sp. B8D3D]|uniref:FecR family protein n=1 Tax=Sphingobium sp. B8D3D TaxID=2940587 RepID=UPI002225A497|nr:FecR domain-containing protein [Sphingobium sp. B8D3D]MCW2414181.1 ferric-dicitrate binding protein FerR (iron transport regulator) [Sphingobium sp. B8D3A]
MKLQDGSVAHLRAGADIVYDMSAKVRKIRLISGQAVFEVAKDATRPFVVQSGDVYAQATGTVYSVNRIGATGGAIHVTEGSVLVWARDGRDQAVLLHQGGKLSLDPGPRAAVSRAPARPVAPEPVIAQISLDNTPIAAAAERFNRVNQTKIIITDPAIGEIKIVGLFRASEPDRFARAAAAVAGAELVYDKSSNVIKLK